MGERLTWMENSVEQRHILSYQQVSEPMPKPVLIDLQSNSPDEQYCRMEIPL